jgi:hypothetical protein
VTTRIQRSKILFSVEENETWEPPSRLLHPAFRGCCIDLRTDLDISISTYRGSSEAAMANSAGKSNDEVLKLDSNRRLMLQFRGSVVTSDVGLLA